MRWVRNMRHLRSSIFEVPPHACAVGVVVVFGVYVQMKALGALEVMKKDIDVWVIEMSRLSR